MSDQKTNLQNIGRVVAGVVDVQQTMTYHFESLAKGLEALKIEHQSGISQLREELRHADERSQKQFAEQNSLHNKEMDRLHNIIHTLLSRDPPAVLPPLPPIQQQQQQQQQQLQQAFFLQRQMELAAQAQAHAQNQAMVNLLNNAGSLPKQVVPPPVQQPLVATPQQQIKPPVLQAQTTPAAVPVPVVVPKPAPEVTIPSNTTTPVVAKPTFPAPVAEKPKPAPAATTTTPASTGFTFGGASTSIFGKKPEPTPQVPAPAAADNEDDEEEYEPQGEFKPVIPLPDLVEVKTGEEGEQVVFNNRSKLYIFANETSEWKERGTGELKVLYNKDAKKWRVVMRRDQVLKVCANFPIVGSMSIQPMRSNEKAYTWFCEDFSEDEPAHVKLSARFANVEIATEFKNLFEKAVAEHKSAGGDIGKEIKSAVVAPKKEIKAEVKEEVVIPSNNKENGFGDKFKPKAGSWECPGCYVSCKAEDTVCACCGTNKDGSSGEKNIFSKPSILQPAPGTSKVTFGFGASAPAKETVQASQFGASLTSSPATSTTPSSIFGGGTPKTGGAPTFSFNAKPTATATATPTFNFNSASPATGSTKGNALFGGAVKTDSTASPAPSFSFGKPADSTAQKPMFSFGKQTTSTASPAVEKTVETPKNVFGSFASGGVSFASLAAKGKDAPSIFDADNVQKAQQELASQKKTSIFGKSATTTADDDNANGEDGEYEPEVDFQPVIPLPDLVEVKTGEEDEEVVFTARCKLYKFFSDTKENKERGVGDIKVLRNAENKFRIVMRREQVHKLCANFRIEKTMKLSPKANLPQVLTFMCQDFSEDPSNPDTAIFTAKFKDETTANDFKKAVQDAQATM